VDLDPARARWLMVATAVLFSTGGTAIKACELSGWQVAGMRSAIAAVVLYAWVPSARRNWTRGVWLVSVFYALTLVMFVVANKLTTAANTIFLQSTAPVYVLLLGPWVLGERWRRHDLAVLAMVAVGMVLFLMSDEETTAIATDPTLGNTLACLAGITWAGTIMGLRKLAEGGEIGAAAASTVVGNLLAAAIALPVAWPLEVGTVTDWTVLLYLGTFQIAAAYVLMTRAMPHLPALTVSLLLMIEPVSSAVIAAVVHGEVPGTLATVGAASILAALGAQAWWARSVDEA
jgi:drug/metabolite transporter (DMT)-like permease